jgi:hypothetical protein
MASSIRDAVRHEAGGLCEYCQMPERFSRVKFSLDHIMARQHRGVTSKRNLAFACGVCNRHKGPNLSGFDPVTRSVVTLFNPRQQTWDEHFKWRGPRLIGKTAVGRATIDTLAINASIQIDARRALIQAGEFPPTT